MAEKSSSSTSTNCKKSQKTDDELILSSSHKIVNPGILTDPGLTIIKATSLALYE